MEDRRITPNDMTDGVLYRHGEVGVLVAALAAAEARGARDAAIVALVERFATETYAGATEDELTRCIGKAARRLIRDWEALRFPTEVQP